MKSLLKLAFVAIIAILGYNYFYGDEKEQQQAENIVNKVKDLGSEIKSLVVSEKDKYDEGKYDNTIDKFSDLITSVKDKISNIDLQKLEDKQAEIKEAVEKLKDKSGKQEERQEEKVEADMEKLFEEIKKAIDGIEIK